MPCLSHQAFVLVRIEQRQLLVAMHDIDGVVDIQRHRLRRRGITRAIRIDQSAGQRHDLAQRRRILPARDRRLGTEIGAAVGQASAGELERRIGAQGIEVVAVLVAARDRQNPRPQNGSEAVRRSRRIARIGDQRRKTVDHAQTFVRRRQKHDAAVGRDAPAIERGADFPARHAWQIKRKISIVAHGGRGASGLADRIGVSNQILCANNPLSYARHALSRILVNKTG